MILDIEDIENTIVVDTIVELTSPEVDFEMYDDIIDDCENAITIYKGLNSDLIPIKIEYLEKILSEFKEKGCNYVSIDYNCDHPDYTFYGTDVHIASKSEIDEENKKNKDKELERIDSQLNALEKQKQELLKKAEMLK